VYQTTAPAGLIPTVLDASIIVCYVCTVDDNMRATHLPVTHKFVDPLFGMSPAAAG
jgi:hypothetical protein